MTWRIGSSLEWKHHRTLGLRDLPRPLQGSPQFHLLPVHDYRLSWLFRHGYRMLHHDHGAFARVHCELPVRPITCGRWSLGESILRWGLGHSSMGGQGSTPLWVSGLGWESSSSRRSPWTPVCRCRYPAQPQSELTRRLVDFQLQLDGNVDLEG